MKSYLKFGQVTNISGDHHAKKDVGRGESFQIGQGDDLFDSNRSAILVVVKRTIKQFYKRILFRLSANNSLIFRWYHQYIYRPKRGSLDEFLNEYSRHNPKLQVLQVGANDGITHDPIHKFIKRDQWQGVLLEPQRDVYKEYLEKIYARNEGIHTLNAALGAVDGEEVIYKIGFSKARWATGLTSFRRDVLQTAFSTGHVARQAKKEGIEVPRNPAQQIIEEKIKVVSIATIKKKFKITDIQLLQIDTEGFDFEIIKLFDLKNDAPKVIIYENIHLTATDKAACSQHLENAGYSVTDYAGNTLAVFQNHSSAASMRQ